MDLDLLAVCPNIENVNKFKIIRPALDKHGLFEGHHDNLLKQQHIPLGLSRPSTCLDLHHLLIPEFEFMGGR